MVRSKSNKLNNNNNNNLKTNQTIQVKTREKQTFNFTKISSLQEN